MPWLHGLRHGVSVGSPVRPLIERTRAQIERRYHRSSADHAFRALLFFLLPYPGRMRFALAPMVLLSGVVSALEKSGLLNLLPRRFRAMLTLAPRTSWSALFGKIPEQTPAVGPARLKVGLLTGCVQRLAFPQVNRATINVLAAEGCVGRSTCRPGLLWRSASSRGLSRAGARARATQHRDLRAAPAVDRIVVNAAGCGSCMKEYGELFADDPQWAGRARSFSACVRDVSELLVELGEPRAVRRPIAARVRVPRRVPSRACAADTLAAARAARFDPGVEVLTPAESEICCGSAGIYNLVESEAAQDLGARKAAHIASLSPTSIATANPGCMLQIAAAGRRSGSTGRSCTRSSWWNARWRRSFMDHEGCDVRPTAKGCDALAGSFIRARV